MSTQGNVPAIINTPAGTLQMFATVLPATANQNVTWSIAPRTGSASINTKKQVTVITNVTVLAKVVSTTNYNIKDSMRILIKNTGVGIEQFDLSEKIKIYPNPFQDKLNVDIDIKENKSFDFGMYNTLAQILLNKILIVFTLLSTLKNYLQDNI